MVTLCIAKHTKRTFYMIPSTAKASHRLPYVCIINPATRLVPTTTNDGDSHLADNENNSTAAYCTCPMFAFNVINRREAIYCKHLLAVRIAHALQSYATREVEDVNELDHLLASSEVFTNQTASPFPSRSRQNRDQTAE
eukprot:GEZU01021703.1.p1 GENE.GEZU01021703.1~~GEZU01021703.1.p1  ORF type:complete len:139 (+),score=4.85 GEZU01021703.1:305-721(+)